jgi:hypothetical protein
MSPTSDTMRDTSAEFCKQGFAVSSKSRGRSRMRHLPATITKGTARIRAALGPSSA